MCGLLMWDDVAIDRVRWQVCSCRLMVDPSGQCLVTIEDLPGLVARRLGAGEGKCLKGKLFCE